MTARLRHSIRRHRDGSVDLTVVPGAGRYPDTYRVSPAELRRFAWAVLVDFDPQEAAAAAAEEGLDLAQACAPITVQPILRPVQGGLGAVGARLPREGTKKLRILRLMVEGSCTLEAIAAEVPAARPDALIYELAASGLVRRSLRGQRLWELTEAATALLSPQQHRQAS